MQNVIDLSHWLSHVRFGVLARGQRFRFVYGPNGRQSEQVFIRAGGRGYYTPEGKRFETGARVTVAIVADGAA